MGYFRLPVPLQMRVTIQLLRITMARTVVILQKGIWRRCCRLRNQVGGWSGIGRAATCRYVDAKCTLRYGPTTGSNYPDHNHPQFAILPYEHVGQSSAEARRTEGFPAVNVLERCSKYSKTDSHQPY
jgi:hypothetical protein